METIKELENKINDVEETLNNLKAKVEELKKNKNSFEPTPKDWKPKLREKYYFTNIGLRVRESTFDNSSIIDEEIIKYNRIFQSEEECQLYCDIQRAFRDASREFKYDSNNYYIWYDHVNKKIKHDCLFSVQHKDIYFDSEETVQNLINKFGEENIKKYYLGVY